MPNLLILACELRTELSRIWREQIILETHFLPTVFLRELVTEE